MSLDLPRIPDTVASGTETDTTWNTVLNTSEGNVSGRKVFQPYPIRQFHLTLGPTTGVPQGDVVEVRNIFNACNGRLYPVAIRDWSDYTLTDQPQNWSAGASSDSRFQLSRTYTPATGNRSLTQPIYLPDQTEVALTLKINGSAYGGSFTVLDYGIIDMHTVLTSGDVVTASGQYLVPACFMEDQLTIKVLLDGLLSIQDVQLREIFEQEIVDLTGVAVPT